MGEFCCFSQMDFFVENSTKIGYNLHTQGRLYAKCPQNLRGRCVEAMTAEQDAFVTKKYHAKREFLLEYAMSNLRDYVLAEEAVQQTFEIACRKIEDFTDSPNPDGWLTKTLGLVIRNMERRCRAERRIVVSMDEYSLNSVEAMELPLPLHVIYGSLVDTPQFRLIYKTEVMGCTLAETARELGISESACKKRAERARKFLKKKLKY